MCLAQVEACNKSGILAEDQIKKAHALFWLGTANAKLGKRGRAFIYHGAYCILHKSKKFKCALQCKLAATLSINDDDNVVVVLGNNPSVDGNSVGRPEGNRLAKRRKALVDAGAAEFATSVQRMAAATEAQTRDLQQALIKAANNKLAISAFSINLDTLDADAQEFWIEHQAKSRASFNPPKPKDPKDTTE